MKSKWAVISVLALAASAIFWHLSKRDLFNAVNRGDLETVRRLSEESGEVNNRDTFGRTALHNVAICITATSKQKRKPVPIEISRTMAQVLIENGIDINAVDNNGYTALTMAAMHNNHAVAEVLLKHGANPNCRDNQQLTPLHWASVGKSLQSTKVLLDHGAKANVQDACGDTPLHDAVVYSEIEIIKELLKAGADPHIKNNRGETVLDYVETSPEPIKELFAN